MNRKILLVEDEAILLETLSYNLRQQGYDVITASDGVSGLECARRGQPDLIILDVLLPKLDGLEVCRLVRRDSAVPILFLTAKTDEVDKVVGLELGADDYMTKPFGIHELKARIKALLRRTELSENSLDPHGVQKMSGSALGDLTSEILSAGDLQVNLATREVICRGERLELQLKLFDLLIYMMRNRGRVLSRNLLLQRIWGYNHTSDMRTIDVHVRWLRERIELDPSNPQMVQTVHGAGYCFRP